MRGAILALDEVLAERRALAEAVAGHREQRARVVAAHDADDLVGVGELDALDARGVAAHDACVVLVKADGHAFLGREEHVVVADGRDHADEVVAVVERDGDDAAAVDVAVVLEARALDAALLRREEEVVLLLLEVLDGEQGLDLLAFAELEEVDDRAALGRARHLGDLPHLDAEHAAGVGEAQEVVVRSADHDLLDVVVVVLVGALDAHAAAALRAVGVERQPLDVSGMADGEHARVPRHEFAELEVLGFVARDLGAARVAKALGERDGVGADDGEDARAVAEDRLELVDLGEELGEFARELLDLEPDELDESQRADGLGLDAREVHAALAVVEELLGLVAQARGHDVDARVARGNAERALHEPRDRLFARAAGADEADDLVDVAHRVDEAFQLVGGLARLAKLELAAAADDVAAVVDVALDQLAQRERARLVVDQRDVLDRVARLERRELVELLLDDRRVRALLEHDLDARARVAARVVAHVGDVGDAVFLRGFDDLLDERALRDLVGDLVDHDRVAAVDLLVRDLAAHDDAAAAGGVRLHDAAAAHDDAARREVGAGDEFHQPLDADQRVVDGRDDRAADLAQVVRRHGARHADGDAARAVDEQVRKLARKHARLHEALVVVRLEVDGLLVEVLHHRHRGGGHAGLGVAHRGRRVAFDRAEVALLVDEHVAGLPVLAHVDERRVDHALAVRVVVAAGVAADLGALDLLATGRQLEVVHRHEDAALRRLESIAHVRQGAIHDRAHRVREVALMQLAVDVEIDHAVVLGRLRVRISRLGAVGHRKTSPFGTVVGEPRL